MKRNLLIINKCHVCGKEMDGRNKFYCSFKCFLEAKQRFYTIKRRNASYNSKPIKIGNSYFVQIPIGIVRDLKIKRSSIKIIVKKIKNSAK